MAIRMESVKCTSPLTVDYIRRLLWYEKAGQERGEEGRTGYDRVGQGGKRMP
jgi:hypothetical protein